MFRSVKDYTFSIIDGRLDQATKAELVDIWAGFGGLTQDEAVRRLAEVILLAKNTEGRVVGIATAVKTFVPQLQNNLYIYRCLIIPEFRAPGLDVKMIMEAKQGLERVARQDKDKPCVGILVVVQNEILKEQWRQSVWRGPDLIYIGNTPKGYPMRVGYFKSARI